MIHWMIQFEANNIATKAIQSFDKKVFSKKGKH